MAFTDTVSSSSESRLIAAAKMGDSDAFGELFERYRDAVHAFVLRSVRRREDAEDIVQETFCRAWKSIGKFRGDSRLTTWLFRIAANLCADFGRSSAGRTAVASDLGIDSEAIAEEKGLESDIAEETVLRQIVNAALDQLNVENRMIVVLCDVNGFSCGEAAKVLGCSVVSARVRLCRARKRLRGILANVLGEGYKE